MNPARHALTNAVTRALADGSPEYVNVPKEGTMPAHTLTVGDTVRAFHPARFGVINTGTVTKVGRKYAHVDFGPMLGGTYRVPFEHVTERYVALGGGNPHTLDGWRTN